MVRTGHRGTLVEDRGGRPAGRHGRHHRGRGTATHPVHPGGRRRSGPVVELPARRVRHLAVGAGGAPGPARWYGASRCGVRSSLPWTISSRSGSAPATTGGRSMSNTGTRRRSAAVAGGVDALTGWRRGSSIPARADRDVDVATDHLGASAEVGPMDTSPSGSARRRWTSLLACDRAVRHRRPGPPLWPRRPTRSRRELVPRGGVYRYLRGQLLRRRGVAPAHLRCSAGTSRAPAGEPDRTAPGWLGRPQATVAGDLPEQVSDHLPAARFIESWRRWGPVATPLLWSHAMYLTLAVESELGR